MSDEALADHDSDEDSSSTNSLTIRPTPRKTVLAPAIDLGLETVVEDYSDLVPEGQSDPFENKVDSFKVNSLSR